MVLSLRPAKKAVGSSSAGKKTHQGGASSSVHPDPPCKPPVLTGDNALVDHWQYNTYFTWIRCETQTMQKLCDIRVQMEGNPHKGQCADKSLQGKHCWTAAECAKFRELYEAAFLGSEGATTDWEMLKKDDEKIHVIWSHLNIVLGRYPRLSEVNSIFKSVLRIWGCRVPIVSKNGEELRDMNDIRMKLLVTIPNKGGDDGDVVVMPLVEIGQKSKCYYIWVSFETKDDDDGQQQQQQAYLQVYTINFYKPAAMKACREAVRLVDEHLAKYLPRASKDGGPGQPTTPLSVSADSIAVHPVVENPDQPEAARRQDGRGGGAVAAASSTEKQVARKKQPCPKGGYSSGFQFDNLESETMMKLCGIRASMQGNPRQRCAASATDGVVRCWSAAEVSQFKELYYDVMCRGGGDARARTFADDESDFWKRLPKTSAMHDFWSHLNIVLGRYPTPSELKTMFPDGALRIWQFSAELFSREPLRGPGLSDIRLRHLVTIPVAPVTGGSEALLLPLVQIGQQSKCFRLWVHVAETDDDTTRAFMSMYAIAHQKKAALQAFERAIALVNEHAATYAPRKPLQPNAPLQILNRPEPRPYNLLSSASSSDDAAELPAPIKDDALFDDRLPPARFPKLPLPPKSSSLSKSYPSLKSSSALSLRRK